MTSAENSVSFGASKFENFLGKDTPRTPYKARGFGTRDNAPRLQKPSYGPAGVTLQVTRGVITNVT